MGKKKRRLSDMPGLIEAGQFSLVINFLQGFFENSDFDKVLHFADAVRTHPRAAFEDKKRACELGCRIYYLRMLDCQKRLKSSWSHPVLREIFNAYADRLHFYEQEIKILEEKNPQLIPEKTLEQELLEADDLFNSQDYPEALRLYEQIGDKVPNSAEASFGAAKCYRRLGEGYRKPSIYSIKDLPSNSNQVSQVVISLSSNESEYYKTSEFLFLVGVELLNDVGSTVPSDIYRELAYLKELQGDFSSGVNYFLLAAEGNLRIFYEYYRKLAAVEFEKKPYHLIFRYNYLLHDEDFLQYCSSGGCDANYRSGLHLDWGVFYSCYNQIDLAVQQYLLALSHSKTDLQARRVLGYLEDMQGITPDLFKNILGMTEIEELRAISLMYIRWMQCDLADKNYRGAAVRFEMIRGMGSIYKLVDGKTLSKLEAAIKTVESVRSYVVQGGSAMYSPKTNENLGCNSMKPSL